MSDPVIVALIGAVATVVGACVQFIFRPLVEKLNIIVDQVKNTHTKNLREDIDEKFAAIHNRLDEKFASWDQRFDSQVDDIRELRGFVMGHA